MRAGWRGVAPRDSARRGVVGRGSIRYPGPVGTLVEGIVAVAVTGVVLGLGFALLERRRGGAPWRRPDFRTDLGWWFVTPLATRAVSDLAILLGVVALAVVVQLPLDGPSLRAALAQPRGLVVGWPTWLQVVVVLAVGDLVGYAVHRAFHRGRLWRFHAVHHSSTRLDWLSSVRVHPVNDVATRVVQAVVILALGFPSGVVAAYVPFLVLYALLLHADVTWDFGPLRGILASPAFHRWHHTADAEGLDRNFAGLFVGIDRVFGTYHLPKGSLPTRLGVVGEPVPDGLLAQLRWPFRRVPAPR